MTLSTPRPLRILGLGGTARPGSTTERALNLVLEAARDKGAQTELLGGEFLHALPHFQPGDAPSPDQQRLLDAVARADGVVVASPGYHGSISGVVKNALDTLELGRGAEGRLYFEGLPVGCVVTTHGWQAAGATLTALRSIIHALRGWPTPYGAALNGAVPLFDDQGACREEKDAWQLATVAEQVMDFARMKAA